MVRNMVNEEYGYTKDMFNFNADLKVYARFMQVFVKLNLVSIRTAQVLMSNYGQDRFTQFRNEKGYSNGN